MLRTRMIELIHREAELSTPENPGYIGMKVTTSSTRASSMCSIKRRTAA